MPAPAIGQRRAWVPGPNAAVDWSHPLTFRLSFLVWVAGGAFHGTRRATAMGSNRAVSSSGYGAALRAATDNSTGIASFGINDALYMPTSTGGGFTAVVVGNIRTPASGSRQFLCYESSSFNGGWGLFVDTAGVGAFAVKTTNPVYVTLSGGSLGAGNAAAVTAMVHNAGNQTLEGWSNGRLVASTAMALMVTSQNSTALRVGADRVDAQSSQSDISMIAIWQRALTGAEHAQLAADPFCMLRF